MRKEASCYYSTGQWAFVRRAACTLVVATEFVPSPCPAHQIGPFALLHCYHVFKSLVSFFPPFPSVASSQHCACCCGLVACLTALLQRFHVAGQQVSAGGRGLS
jgi:hypothetical protein